MRNTKISSSLLLSLVLAVGAACTDTTPSAPSVAAPDVATPNAAQSPARGRTPYISSLQLSSIYVPLTSGYTPFTVTVNNSSLKSLYNIYLKGVVQQDSQSPWPTTAFLAYCPNPNGVLQPGDCIMSNGITALGSPNLHPGPATFTLMVQQQQSNGSMKVLDSKSVSVVLTN